MTAMPDGSGIDADAALLAQFADGDQSAARALTEQLLPGAMRQAWRMLGDQAEAEDVAQDAMMRLWKQATDWRAGEARVSTWLYRFEFMAPDAHFSWCCRRRWWSWRTISRSGGYRRTTSRCSSTVSAND